MENRRVDELVAMLEEINSMVDKKIAEKLELDKCDRIIKRLGSFSTECEVCAQSLADLEKDLTQLRNNLDKIDQNEIKIHQQKISQIVSHLQKEHRLVQSDYHLSIYMSIGMGLGLVFGLVIFDNLALGLPIGMGIGIAIGAGLDEDAKKKGRTI